jgi:signal transduction histidine kinase
MELDLDVSRSPDQRAKHAQASVVRLDAVVHDGRPRLGVRDDGTGGAHPSRGFGLIGLTDRVEALGATMTIVSPRHSGTTIEVELPLTALEQG